MVRILSRTDDRSHAICGQCHGITTECTYRRPHRFLRPNGIVPPHEQRVLFRVSADQGRVALQIHRAQVIKAAGRDESGLETPSSGSGVAHEDVWSASPRTGANKGGIARQCYRVAHLEYVTRASIWKENLALLVPFGPCTGEYIRFALPDGFVFPLVCFMVLFSCPLLYTEEENEIEKRCFVIVSKL